MELSGILVLLGAASLVYVVAGAIRRLYFSPLSQFPGPRFAALTLWNEFYWDVVKRGTFMWRIQEMHEKHGNPTPLVSFLLPPASETAPPGIRGLSRLMLVAIRRH